MTNLDAFYRLVAELRGKGYSEPKAYHEAEAMMEETMKLDEQKTQGDQR